MERNELSLKYVNLRTGGITAHPVNDGVYLKTIVKMKDDAMALFPTTISLTIFDGLEFYTEMKLNSFKASHPDFAQQCENLRRLILSLGIGEAYTTRLIYATDEVAIVDENGIHLRGSDGIGQDYYSLFNEPMQLHVDAIITNRRNVALLMYCADCPTAFLRDKKTGAIGVLHSMWRGMVIEHENGSRSSIVKKTVEAMTCEYGTNPEDLEVTIFPCAGLDQYEIGEDVSVIYRERNMGRFINYDYDGQAHLNLSGAMREQFIRSGVKEESIEMTPFTTAHYGFNSLRLAPTNCTLGAEGITGTQTYQNVCTQDFTPSLHLPKEVKDHTIRSSASNFLIAMRT